MNKNFAAPALPARGQFKTSKRELIELCVRAQRAAPAGGYVGLRGRPVVIRSVDIRGTGDDVVATVRYERVRARDARHPAEMLRRH